jgi:hypothetical protein
VRSNPNLDFLALGLWHAFCNVCYELCSREHRMGV